MGSPQGDLRVPGGSGEGVLDDVEDGGNTRWERKRRYSKLPKSSSPAANISQFLSVLTTRLRMGTPYINIFSGDAIPVKTGVSSGHWYHEDQFVKDHYQKAVVWESIIWS